MNGGMGVGMNGSMNGGLNCGLNGGMNGGIGGGMSGMRGMTQSQYIDQVSQGNRMQVSQRTMSRMNGDNF